ncbi:8910_t:CDS:10 [Dentiscutata erythropus]|uniref:8910_t:CDS:1 n=1 Tax=Dentiscutata erythropus TaxID=1348616 RepID=A0A9N9NER9_9GLOM|nr:8910_t:CDS:10 [Dentiscutata erythropus]
MQAYGLLYAANDSMPVPLQNVSAEANIVDMIAEVTVCQTYKNVEHDTIEAIYRFPLFEAAAIRGFEAEIDGNRNVKGIVKEAEQAAKEYDEAIQKLKMFDLFFLLLDLSITCRMSSAIQSIESPSHNISVELNVDGNPNVSRITLKDKITYLEKDFILVIKSLGLDQPRAFIEYDSMTGTNCIMLTLVPILSINIIKTELIFVIDRSGSMQGGPIKKASNALKLLLRSLPKDCFFNIISFGFNFDPLFEKSLPYSEETLSKALKHAQEMSANYGGTEIYAPLKWAFENLRNDMPTSVFLLTDGQVDNVDQIIELVKSCEEKKKDNLRIFSIGIGDSVSYHLVESVSRVGKGYSQFITNTERMDKKILEMLKNAIKPSIKDYNITWTNQKFSSFNDNTIYSPADQNTFINTKIQQAPFLIPPIYSGVRFIVYCLLEKGIEAREEITLIAMSNDGPIKISIPLDPVLLNGSTIHALAARKLIQDLDDGTSFIHKHPRNNEKNIPDSFIREQIVKLGTIYNLASKHTSFLAIDERDNRSVAESKNLRIIPTKTNGFFYNYFIRKPIDSVIVHDELYDEGEFVSDDDLRIDTLYSFLELQSYDGSFLPTTKFYSWFGKKDFNDFSIIGIENEKVLCSALAIAYFEIVMFKEVKEECELIYEKTRNVLTAEVVDKQILTEILEKAREWLVLSPGTYI